MLFAMSNPFTLFLSLCLLLFTSNCLASFQSLRRCQLDKINVLTEPDHRVEAEGGVVETWNSFKHRDLSCVGFTLAKRTLYPNGLHLPSYSPYPQLMLIVQGRGAIGIAIPGCADTYEEPQEQDRGKQPQDSHQKIRHVIEGDIVLIPPGVPYWSFNYANERFVALSLLDTSSNLNQLDETPRVFYVAGKPDTEHPESVKRGEEDEEGRSVVSGFRKHLIAQSLSTDEETAEQLQSQDDERKQIIKVRKGLSVITPTWEPKQTRERKEKSKSKCKEKSEETEEEKEEGEVEEEDEPGYHRTRKWKRKETRPKHGGEHKGEKEVEVEEEEEEWGEKGKKGKGTEKEKEEEEEVEVEEEHWEEKGKKEKARKEKRVKNGNALEETLCSAKLHENIANPSRADFYNPRAGRITELNSVHIPALRIFGLSAQYVVLYKEGIHSPHWNLNSNSVMSVTRGRGTVTVVNCQGKTVFDGELKRGQMLVVPQNMMVSQEAGREGFEYVVFKTNDTPVTGHLKDFFRAIPAEVLSNAYGLRHSQVTQVKYNGNWGPLVNPHSTPRSPAK
ncbi:hypothetical protein VNO77_16382 [Canavalia gladiata]|uniref:Cupin type-1 domain-containing protein n=1 Tax=Canavalia gladiata TaxID=3824 RepID=A0AAN9QT17_CANGL